MPYLILDHERFALQIGENTLGGDGDDAVLLPALAGLPPIAVVTYWPGGDPSVRRVAPAPTLLVDDEPLGGEPRALCHGTRIEVGGLRLVYGDLETAQGTTSHVASVDDAQLAALAAPPEHVAPDTGGRLIDVRTGRTIPIPGAGLVIGRDPECDVVLRAKDVSRRHAAIHPSLYGYVLSNESANGVYVNGTRVQGQYQLGQGDLLCVADATFRFEGDTASLAPSAELLAPAHVRSGPLPAAPATPVPGTLAPSAHAVAPPVPQLLATLEVASPGELAGLVFRIDRTLTTIGRGEPSDVRLRERSVSGAHATLLLDGANWRLVDLDSTNGSYVDGVRVAEERLLPVECLLQVGDVQLLFRSFVDPPPPSGPLRRIIDAAMR